MGVGGGGVGYPHISHTLPSRVAYFGGRRRGRDDGMVDEMMCTYGAYSHSLACERRYIGVGYSGGSQDIAIIMGKDGDSNSISISIYLSLFYLDDDNEYQNRLHEQRDLFLQIYFTVLPICSRSVPSLDLTQHAPAASHFLQIDMKADRKKKYLNNACACVCLV